MIPQRYEVKSWNEWDGVSLKPAVDGDLALYADAEKKIGVLTAQRDKATKDVEELIKERRTLLDERGAKTAENRRLGDRLKAAEDVVSYLVIWGAAPTDKLAELIKQSMILRTAVDAALKQEGKGI